MSLSVDSVLDGRYRIISHIKIGGMSNIYKAEDKRLEKICAVKELLCRYDEEKEFNYAVKRFKEEAKLLADLCHPNLPRVSDYFTQEVYYYLVMDFIEGVDLETLLKRNDGKGLDEDSIINWSIQICDVLDYLHSQKPKPIVYRDIKPGNIMIRKNSEKVVLIDFGIARKIEPRDTVTAIGTMEYAPMEQYQGKAEPRSDIYSLGATMHHLLTAKPPKPFKFPPVRTIRGELSEEVEEIVSKALSSKAEDRFKSAREMQGKLLSLLSSRKINPHPKKKQPSEELLKRLRQGDISAAVILGEMKAKDAVYDLIITLDSNDPDLRREAAIALGKIGDTTAISPLVELLKKERTSGNLKIEEALQLLKLSDYKKETTFWDSFFCKMKEFFSMG